jgi:hypothetical protein
MCVAADVVAHRSGEVLTWACTPRTSAILDSSLSRANIFGELMQSDRSGFFLLADGELVRVTYGTDWVK